MAPTAQSAQPAAKHRQAALVRPLLAAATMAAAVAAAPGGAEQPQLAPRAEPEASQ